MTPQENEKLRHFLNQLIQAQGVPKDPEADALIRSAVARQPDAAYLLVQRALLLDQALDSAKAQIADLQDRLQAAAPARSSGSFLSGADAWGNSARTAPAPAPVPAPAPAYPQQAAPAYVPAAGPDYQFNQQRGYGLPAQRQGGWANAGGSGSFLGTMAATAAGVAGGAFLYHGLENMFSHHDQGNQHGLGSNFGDSGNAAGLGAASGQDNLLGREAGLDDIGQSSTNYVDSAPAEDSAGLMDDSGSFDDYASGDDDSSII